MIKPIYILEKHLVQGGVTTSDDFFCLVKKKSRLIDIIVDAMNENSSQENKQYKDEIEKLKNKLSEFNPIYKNK